MGWVFFPQPRAPSSVAGLQSAFSRTGLYASVMPAQSHNLQIRDVIDAIAQSDSDLFNNETAILMPVKVSARLENIDTDNPNYEPLKDATEPVICDSELGDTIEIAEIHTLRLRLMAWARLHADEQARYWRELLTA